MELSKNFDHQKAEAQWYKHWIEKKYFHSTPDDREPYTIVIPPPNVTGILHMGHCLNNTIQDILIRYQKMRGKNTCWVPGTDHASIATEAKVVQMLREKGIQKSSLSREEFLKYAWEWKEKYGGIILEQLKKLGCSLDWDRTNFTMDADYYKSVIQVFNDLYAKGYIYRGKRMINWDVKAKTALSDEEVIRKETHQKLYYVKYFVEENNKISDKEFITIATVRPETIMGDTAVCVHPKDDRFKKFHGKFVFVPLINRRIPIIIDEYVTMDFGTGALKITPAHDVNDYNLGEKHNLPIIEILDETGKLNENAEILIGEDRFEARKKVTALLKEQGFLIKTEDYTSEVGYSERTDEVVEPRLSLQWWVDMKKMSTPAFDAVMNDEIKFHPVKYKNLYRHWMENIKDWCISRQLWWGHRIPAWYDADGNFVVAIDENDAKEKYEEQFKKKNITLHQDEACLDTWFSSWLWPIEVFNGMSDAKNKEIDYYYPTSTLVTAPEIIFFWVARMIMAGYEYKNEKPFSQVYFTGIVRDNLGRKMSKSLGNSPDLLALIDKYGADAVRFGIMIASPAGNDLLWSENSNEQGSFFVNKIWNALKLIKTWENRLTDEEEKNNFALEWFDEKIKSEQQNIEKDIEEFRLSEALKTLYSLIWDDFCSWYLEWIKPAMDKPLNRNIYNSTLQYFEKLLQLLHPFMPFVTEEIYHLLQERKDDLIVKQILPIKNFNQNILDEGNYLKEIITGIRDVRVKNNIKNKIPITLFIETKNEKRIALLEKIIAKQLNVEAIKYNEKEIPASITFVLQQDKFYIHSSEEIDNTAQQEQMQKELTHLKSFLISVDKKLSNEKFIQNAKPEVIAIEQKKKADALAKVKIIEESLNK